MSSVSLQNFESCNSAQPIRNNNCKVSTWDNNDIKISTEEPKEGKSALLLVGNHQWPGVAIGLDKPTKMDPNDTITFWINPKTSNDGPNTYAVKLWDVNGNQAEVWTDHGQDPNVSVEFRPSPVRVPDNVWTKVSMPVSQFRGLTLNGQNGGATKIEIKGYWDNSTYLIDNVRLEKP